MAHTSVVIDFARTGLGLDYGTVSLVPVLESWADIAAELAAEIQDALGDLASDVQHIGSTTCVALLAKPIVDLAIAVPVGTQVEEVVQPMSRRGWIYRGDAGDDGGWVFVLEDRPRHRVAHAHGVAAIGSQWRRYLEFRELLGRSADARQTYQAAKIDLARAFRRDVGGYTAGKDTTVRRLLTDAA
jgi:GrpB-like predicted nucleotidyltransferase (UPF0157 family)